MSDREPKNIFFSKTRNNNIRVLPNCPGPIEGVPWSQRIANDYVTPAWATGNPLQHRPTTIPILRRYEVLWNIAYKLKKEGKEEEAKAVGIAMASLSEWIAKNSPPGFAKTKRIYIESTAFHYIRAGALPHALHVARYYKQECPNLLADLKDVRAEMFKDRIKKYKSQNSGLLLVKARSPKGGAFYKLV